MGRNRGLSLPFEAFALRLPLEEPEKASNTKEAYQEFRARTRYSLGFGVFG